MQNQIESFDPPIGMQRVRVEQIEIREYHLTLDEFFDPKPFRPGLRAPTETIILFKNADVPIDYDLRLTLKFPVEYSVPNITGFYNVLSTKQKSSFLFGPSNSYSGNGNIQNKSTIWYTSKEGVKSNIAPWVEILLNTGAPQTAIDGKKGN